MSSFNDCIKFSLNIKDKNIIFLDCFNKFTNGKAHKVYLAELLQHSKSSNYEALQLLNKVVNINLLNLLGNYI